MYEAIKPQLCYGKIREICDILICVDTDADFRFIRRLKRDIEEKRMMFKINQSVSGTWVQSSLCLNTL